MKNYSVLALVLAAIVVYPLSAFSQTTHEIVITDNQFEPAQVDVEPGDTVVWRNEDSISHRIVSGYQAIESGLFDSGVLEPGDTFAYTFDAVAEIQFYCTAHPNNTGWVYVEAPAGQLDNKTILTLQFRGFSDYYVEDPEEDPLNMYIRAIDTLRNMEAEREEVFPIIQEDFDVTIENLYTGRKYDIEFFIDINANGLYDEDDASWSITFESLAAGSLVPISQTTGQTRLDWDYTVHLDIDNVTMYENMKAEFRLMDVEETKRVSYEWIASIEGDSLDVMLPGMTPDANYNVEFYIDQNKNGVYDAPPIDHAWRLSGVEAMGDTTITVDYGMEYTDIGWSYILTLMPSDYDVHIGDMFKARIIDRGTGNEAGRATIPSVGSGQFSVAIPGMEYGHSYRVELWVDMNGNNVYDAPPVDHAWRIIQPELTEITGDVYLPYPHNTTFEDIEWDYQLNVNMMNMAPVQGKRLYARVTDTNPPNPWEKEASRTNVCACPGPNFALRLAGLDIGRDYYLDIFVDENENGEYDAPPTDKAWRIEVDDIVDDRTVDFTSNEQYTDIGWTYTMSMTVQELDQYIGNLMEYRLREYDGTSTGTIVSVGEVPSIPTSEVMVQMSGMEMNGTYALEFYIDSNDNGGYDPPPTDPAWREIVENISGNEEMVFIPGPDYTDISWPDPVSVDETNETPEAFALGNNYPNPFNMATTISYTLTEPQNVQLAVYNTQGQKVRVLEDGHREAGNYSIVWNGLDESGSEVSSGIYFYRLTNGTMTREMRMLLVK